MKQSMRISIVLLAPLMSLLAAKAAGPEVCVTGAAANVCAGKPFRINWSAALCSAPQPYTNQECTRNGPKFVWPGGTVGESWEGPEITAPAEPGIKYYDAPSVTSQFLYALNSGVTGVTCPPPDGIPQRTGQKAMVTIKGVKNFAANPLLWPKCKNEPISETDFTITKFPADYPTTFVPPSSATPGTFNAELHHPCATEPMLASYTVLEYDGVNPAPTPPSPQPWKKTSTGVTVTRFEYGVGYVSSVTTTRNVSSTGTSVPTEVPPRKGWTPCGTAVTIGDALKSEWTVGGSLGLTIKEVFNAGVSGAYTSGHVFKYEYEIAAAGHRSYLFSAWKHPVTSADVVDVLTETGIITWGEGGTTTSGPTSYAPPLRVVESSSFELDGQTQTTIRCCN